MSRSITAGRACALLLAIAIPCAGVAHARDHATGGARSVAGAQEFLRQVLPGNRYASTMMSEILERAGREGLRAHFEPLPPIFDAAPLAKCRSLLLADIRATDLVVRDPATGEAAVSALAELVNDEVVGSPDGFDFGSIRALRQSGNRVLLRFAGEQSDAVLYLEGEETAARVHTALDYLRRHCDASAATGF
ncbi:hypothetical protein [Luteimonas sp. SDU101]|uniref:hypothetical protein n=1 Tax=Luteimonas sp. SDU101 TaxID=3422593 RepID=UPI003EB7033A